MAFARAIGDPNPIYYSATAAAEAGYRDVVAPPTFVQAIAHFDPDYHQRPPLGQPWRGSGRTVTGTSEVTAAGGTRLHAEQHYTYHRPVVVGDVLSPVVVATSTWEKDGRRSGHLTFTETTTEYRDDHGALVLTARSVSVATSRTVDVEPTGERPS